MKNILLLHGPNLNKLGQRDTTQYGTLTLSEIENVTKIVAHTLQWQVIPYQSNHEGVLIDIIQKESDHCHAIVINPGAFAHYSYALYDALVDAKLPTIEVHLSNIEAREAWRKNSVISPACIKVISGKKEQGYQEAIYALDEYFSAGQS